MFEADPAGWAAFLGVDSPVGGLRVIDSDLSAVSLAADKVLRVEDDPPRLLHVEFQSDWDRWLPRRFLAYNAVLAEKHELPVATLVVLLAPPVRTVGLTGRYVSAPPFGPPTEFGYTVVRVWEVPADRLLVGPLALVPLAPVAANPAPGLLARAVRRVVTEAGPAATDGLLAAIGYLLQLRYGKMQAGELLRMAIDAREDGPFWVFVQEGRAEGRRELLLALGREKFGPPSPEQEAAVKATTDPARLDDLAKKLLRAATWDDLLKPD